MSNDLFCYCWGKTDFRFLEESVNDIEVAENLYILQKVSDKRNREGKVTYFIQLIIHLSISSLHTSL